MSLVERLKAVQLQINEQSCPLVRANMLRQYMDFCEKNLNGDGREHYAFAAQHYARIAEHIKNESNNIENESEKKRDRDLVAKFRRKAKDCEKKAQDLTSTKPPSYS